MVRSKIKGMDEVLVAIRGVSRAVKEGARKGVAQVAEDIRGKAVRLAPTPEIKAAMYVNESEKGGILSAKVVADRSIEPELLFVEMGTGVVANRDPTLNGMEKAPLPDTAYTLHPWTYYDEVGRATPDGMPGFVTTEGQRANPSLYPAALLVEDYYDKTIKEAIQKELKKAGR